MITMRIGICDDNIDELNNINSICQNLGYNNIFSFSSGQALLEDNNLSLDLLFLDIEMDQINGIELKNHFEQNSVTTLIVFTTSHTELMQDAFGKNVISFIPKPCSEHAVAMCIERAAFLLHDYYQIGTDDGITLISRDVLYMRAEQKYTIIYTTDGNSYHSRKPISQWIIELYRVGYCQISRSVIINMIHYKDIHGNEIVLTNGNKQRVSRRYLQGVKQCIYSRNPI